MSITPFWGFHIHTFGYGIVKETDMENTDTLTAIFTRRSIRKFSSAPVSREFQKILLCAAMAAPASENVRNQRFIVITDRNILDVLPSLHPSAEPAREAPLAILVCCDTSYPQQTVFWPQDCAAAIENIMLAARAVGLGTLWCGIHPMELREKAFMKAFKLPGMIRPAGLLLIGYPLQTFFEEDRYSSRFVHANQWGIPYDEEQPLKNIS